MKTRKVTQTDRYVVKRKRYVHPRYSKGEEEPAGANLATIVTDMKTYPAN